MTRLSISILASPRTLHEVHHLVRRARDVLATGCIVSVRPIGREAYRIVTLSSSRGYWKVGGLALAVRKGDYEAIHYAMVSKRGFRCSCVYSIRMSARADAVLESLGLPMVGSKYSLCKHVLASIAVLSARGELDLRCREFKEALVKGLAVLYLAVEDADRVSRNVEVIKRILVDRNG